MSGDKLKVYCAGPLFTKREREEMAELAHAVERAGFKTFLPQRDGLELTACADSLVSRGLDRDLATKLVSRAIFSLDVYQVVKECNAIVVNLNGRVPDEGAVSEAALAWCANKIVVGYKADHRSVFMGHDNPMVAGLFAFRICNTISDMAFVLSEELGKRKELYHRADYGGKQIEDCLGLGKKLWEALSRREGIDNVAEVLLAGQPEWMNSPRLDNLVLSMDRV